MDRENQSEQWMGRCTTMEHDLHGVGDDICCLSARLMHDTEENESLSTELDRIAERTMALKEKCSTLDRAVHAFRARYDAIGIHIRLLEEDTAKTMRLAEDIRKRTEHISKELDAWIAEGR